MTTIPCSWDVSCEACPAFTAEGTEDWQRDAALWMASTYLWAATGRQYGTCPVTVRPNQPKWPAEAAYPEWLATPWTGGGPFLFGGRWFNAGCGSACCGRNACAVVLRGPVAAITAVVVDGETVPSSAYRVDVRQGTYLLVRVDGACWPSCQDWTAGPDEVGSFEVTYQIGTTLPEALKVVTALLACEYLKSLQADSSCRLPARMTSLSRQGIEVELADVDQQGRLTSIGLTGIREVDDVVRALNPSGRQRPGYVLSPDAPGNCDRVTTIAAGG